ncbi:hypothetical protein ONS95_001109 [Cadophora gregata]|uniref:uncharacterized protein n=1 Tax=Cadophora gregata TaxID=51156 RepID=UPI0026DCC70A|nr:uncharacterized protein ONS95_001109 [Cadophora gregata]KAK0129174.1 hypothetical protein ONS95_001109 [Cadophora gregata]
MMNAETLETRALRQFDALVQRGELLWQANTPLLVQTGPFKFQFRSTPSYTKKPIQKADDPGRTSDQNVFSDTDPDFVIDFIGPSHKLILNKYSIVRPQYVLHTTAFTPQSDHLNAVDFDAAWNVVSRLESRNMVIYNCGVEAGSSIGHKHLQILPRPERKEFEMFPDALGIDNEKSEVRGLPFRHAVKLLSSSPSVSELVSVYEKLKIRSRVNNAHNVILVKEWMLVIPRSCARHGNLAANAASMAGLAWVNKLEDIQNWIDRGPMELLRQFGVAKG